MLDAYLKEAKTIAAFNQVGLGLASSRGVVVAAQYRPVPSTALDPGLATRSDTPWVPWHIDILDSLSLDGKFLSTADGTGVNVYLVSSGGFIRSICSTER